MRPRILDCATFPARAAGYSVFVLHGALSLTPGGLATALASSLLCLDRCFVAHLWARSRLRFFARRVKGSLAIGARTRRAWAAAGLMLWFGLTTASASASAPGAAGADTVRSFYDALLANMRSGSALGAHGRYTRIEPVVRRTFDVSFMTRLAVGPEWERLDEVRRHHISHAFQQYISAIYAERFDSYSGETLQVTGEKPSSLGTIITTEIVKSDGGLIHLSYLMRQNDGVWQIADVYLNGTISELAARRSEFSSIIRARGIDGLVAVLKNKTESLAAQAF
jgi:phospholipid transport system substrate-binding protein